MEHIIKYLLNPIKTGVYHSQFIVDFSSAKLLFSDLAEIAKKREPKLWKPLKTHIPYQFSTISDEGLEESIQEIIRDETLDFFKEMTMALNIYTCFDECPKEILWYLSYDGQKQQLYYDWEDEVQELHEVNQFHISNAFDSHILSNTNDVIVIEPEKNGLNELSLEITTITKKGTAGFHDFLKSIPHVGDKVKEIHKRKTHSSRYAFRPYDLAVSLWLDSERAIAVPEDLRNFLYESQGYIYDEEWRTAVVLSAICVESVLADIYEEEFKEHAPNVTLGELYHRVKSKKNFPTEIAKAIELVNEARISAVHRSRFPVSDREAINALYGSTAFVIWYFSKD